MKRKEDIELRRAVRKAAQTADQRVDVDDYAPYDRMWYALRRAETDDSVTEAGRAFLKASREILDQHRAAMITAGHNYRREMRGLAFLLGVR